MLFASLGDFFAFAAPDKLFCSILRYQSVAFAAVFFVAKIIYHFPPL